MKTNWRKLGVDYRVVQSEEWRAIVEQSINGRIIGWTACKRRPCKGRTFEGGNAIGPSIRLCMLDGDYGAKAWQFKTLEAAQECYARIRRPDNWEERKAACGL